MRALFTAALILCLDCCYGAAQTGAVSGFCVSGATSSLTSGLPSSNKMQGIIPQCTVTVYLTGTTTKATLYSDALNTPLGNPFQANIDGSWLFFASTGNLYDVVLSGGVPPNTYATPRTITGLAAAFGTVAGTTILPAGATITTAILAAACPGTTQGVLILPSGAVNLSTMTNFPSNCRMLGQGAGQSTINISNGTPILTAFDFNGVTASQISGVTLACAQSPATCNDAIRVRYSTNLSFDNLVITGSGYGNISNPRAGIYFEDDDNILLDTTRFANNGGVYTVVNGYNGLPSTRMHVRNVTDDNNLAQISMSFFDCQYCTVDGGTTINGNNQTSGSNADGYGILFYATNTTYPLTSGCTGSGTITCTIPLTGGGTTQLPVGPTFKVLVNGVTGGTGTLNGVFPATLVSSTTFTVAGVGNTSGASYASAIAFYPTTNEVINDVHIKNTAGTGIYLQGAEYTSVTGYEMENVDQQQTGGSLPTGCIAINGGNPLVVGYSAHGNSIGPGVCNGTGQYGLDFANTTDLVVTGMTINNAGLSGIRAFGGSFTNTGFKISGVTVDNSPKCFTTATGGSNTGDVEGMQCSNFTQAGIIPQTGPGLNFSNISVNVSSYLPCIDEFKSGNVYNNVKCFGGYDLIAGTNTKIIGGGVYNTTTSGSPKHAVQFFGTQHLFMADFWIDTVNDGMFFVNQGATQNSDITIKSAHLMNVTAAPAIWDNAPTAVTIATSSSNTVTVTTGVTVAIGMGLGDYGTGGNNDIPVGTTITNVSGTCSTGCTLTLSQSATGTHASDPALLQQTMSSGVRLWDTDIQGSATVSQALLLYGMQGIDIQRISITGFTTQGMIDLRGDTNGATINTANVVGGSGALAAVYLGGGILGSAINVNVTNLTASGTLTNSLYDHTIGTGNVFNLFEANLNGIAISTNNANLSMKGTVLLTSLSPAATSPSTCAEQTFSTTGTGTVRFQAGQVITVSPPASSGAHVWIASARVSAANTVAINFCADATGGTAPAGTYTAILN